MVHLFTLMPSKVPLHPHVPHFPSISLLPLSLPIFPHLPLIQSPPPSLPTCLSSPPPFDKFLKTYKNIGSCLMEQIYVSQTNRSASSSASWAGVAVTLERRALIGSDWKDSGSTSREPALRSTRYSSIRANKISAFWHQCNPCSRRRVTWVRIKTIAPKYCILGIIGKGACQLSLVLRLTSRKGPVGGCYPYSTA